MSICVKNRRRDKTYLVSTSRQAVVPFRRQSLQRLHSPSLKLGTSLLLVLLSIVSANEMYDSLWSSLDARHSATMRYYTESALPTEARREQLATGQSLSGGPTFSGSVDGLSEGMFQLGHRIDWTHPRWSSSLYLTNSDEQLENGSFRLMYAILSDLNTRLEDLDTVTALIRRKALLQREAVLFNDFKLLLQYKVQYDLFVAEEEIRASVDRKGQKFLEDLNRLITAGVVPKNATQSIKLFLRDNALRVNALQLESELLVDNVFYNFEIDSTLFLGLEIDSLLPLIALDSAVNHADYTWKMDSLNTEIQKAQLQEQNRNSWRLEAGVGTAFTDYSTPEEYNNSVMVQFRMGFHKKVLPEDRPLKKRVVQPKSNEILDDLTLYRDNAQEYSKNATEWINTTLQRIKLGELGIMYELSQNLDIIINNQLKYHTLKANYYRRELSQFRSIEQLADEVRPAL